MKRVIFTLICLASVTTLVLAYGCASQPITTPTTLPATQSTQPTPAQVIDGAAKTVTTYGPVVQAVLAAIPTTAPAAVWLGIALLVLNSIEKNFGGANAPKTKEQWTADLEAFAADLLPQLTAALPGKTATEIQSIVNVAKTVAAAQASK